MTQSCDSNDKTNLFSRLTDRFAKRAVRKYLTKLQRGALTVRDAEGAMTFGDSDELEVTLAIHRPAFFRRVLLGGALSFAESYTHGDWDSDDLTKLLRVFARNSKNTESTERGVARLTNAVRRLGHWWRLNTLSGSRRNITAHYDLGNEFFRLWLDDTLGYSCGVFPLATSSLREASIEKFDRICRKLHLQPSDRVLEIGTGWGGFAIHAAKNYGCHVTSTTISREQLRVANERVKAAGLTDRVTLLGSDYRELHGEYDKLVSIEMIEAVGHRYFDTYFRKCSSLLHPQGSFVLQAIVMPEQGYEKYLRSVDFIQQHIFPGGCLPSLGSMLASIARATDLQLVKVEDFGPHYAETLRRWRHNFASRRDEVRRLGYSEQFIRMWTYYLCYCEAAFEERCIGVLQIQFDKPERRIDEVFLASSDTSQGDSQCSPLVRRSRERLLNVN